MRTNNQNLMLTALTSAIFFVAAGLNLGLIIEDGLSTFRIIASIAFTIGGIVLLIKYKRRKIAVKMDTDNTQ